MKEDKYITCSKEGCTFDNEESKGRCMRCGLFQWYAYFKCPNCGKVSSAAGINNAGFLVIKCNCS